MALNGTRVGWLLAALLLLVLVGAWVDGGKEPLHPIEEPVKLPGAGK